MMLASRIYDSLDYYYKLSQGVITILLAIVALLQNTRHELLKFTTGITN